MKGSLLLFLALVSGMSPSLPSQCNSYQPSSDQVSIGPETEAVVTDAVLLLDCCGTCTGNQEALSGASALADMLDEGRILKEDDGDTDWFAATSPDCVFGNTDVWNTSNTNFIILNDNHLKNYGYSYDDQASAAIMAAILAHEYLHCITMVNSCPTGTIEMDNNCDYWENEYMCSMVEVAILDCILQCGCINAGLVSPAGQVDIQNQQERASTQVQFWADILGGC